VLAEVSDEIDEKGASSRDEAALRRDGGSERGDARADAPAGALEALDRVNVLERPEQAGNGRLRKPDALGDVGDSGRPLRHLVQDRERALERLHHGRRSPRIPRYSIVPRYGTDERGNHRLMPDDDLDLKSLTDDELVTQMHDDLYDGLADEIVEGTEILLERGWAADKVLNDALVEGMRIVGIDFRDGILFVPEVLLAANAMKAGMELLRPLLAETGAERIGTVVIGTVKGDIHDIGKKLVAVMIGGAGFEVYDLGINNPVENYLAALEEHEPDILGMSALLTTTMPYMKVVIDTLKEKGIRDDYIVLVGGAPLNEEFGKAIGADAYCR